jgi:hypothetical protein
VHVIQLEPVATAQALAAFSETGFALGGPLEGLVKALG